MKDDMKIDFQLHILFKRRNIVEPSITTLNSLIVYVGGQFVLMLAGLAHHIGCVVE